MLTAKRIDTILYDCVFRNDEIINGKPVDETKLVTVPAIHRRFGLHKTRLESYREEIKSYVQQLPMQFHKGTGDGWSFMNLTMDKYYNGWGEQIHAETLYALAAGLGMAKFTMPREMWDVLPGSVPYIVFDINQMQET
jgi:hypothetical protein